MRDDLAGLTPCEIGGGGSPFMAHSVPILEHQEAAPVFGPGISGIGGNLKRVAEPPPFW